ncbi:Histidine decarboxylase [Nostoc sp. DSM 114161]|jgi:histidine decarboxylase|uniref:histidine decarboxylase n=1 Tax=Nostoc sp. DSM 114161 TaxID=3440143 RepID=UPI00404622A1
MDIDFLSEYQMLLTEASQFHLGYPYNLKHDNTFLLPFLKYSINNLGGDCFTKSHYRIDSRDFEKEVLQFFANLYQLQDWWGYVTTSGTEGNLYGILLGRENYPDGILYASAASHYSVNKAAKFFRIPYHQIGIQTPSEEMNYSDFYRKLVPNLPAIICLNLGTTFTGAIDDIEQILNALEMKKIRQFYIHVDGALGGMLLPYLRSHWIDFHKPISSLSISGHKFIGCPFPCGIVITKKHLVEALASDIEYLGAQDMTIGGSRNGHTSLCLWYEICKRHSNFALEVADCVAKAEHLYAQLKLRDFNPLLNPYSNTVVFDKPSDSLVKKYQLAARGDYAHAVVMQNHYIEFLDYFVEELAREQLNLAKIGKG